MENQIMDTKNVKVTNETAAYLIAFAITIIAIVLVGGGFWVLGTI